MEKYSLYKIEQLHFVSQICWFAYQQQFFLPCENCVLGRIRIEDNFRCCNEDSSWYCVSRAFNTWDARFRNSCAQIHNNKHTHTHPFNSSFSTRVSRYQKGKTIWILLKQETVTGSGISWAICKSATRSRQITMLAPTTQFFTCRIPSLPPNQQHQSTEGTPQPQETLPLTGTKSYCLVIES